MTFKIVIEIIRKECGIRGNRDQFVRELCKTAGAEDISLHTIASWFKKGTSKRSPDFNAHFKGYLNETAVIEFFKYQTQPYWKEVLKQLHAKNTTGTISCDTEDEFYIYLLHQFLRFLNLSPILLSHTHIDKPVIFGRKDKLEELADILKSSNYAAITGIGGIGKSHTVLAYAHGLQNSGKWVIQYVMCEDSDSLRDAVARLQFNGLKDNDKDENTKFDLKIDALKNYHQLTLIIFDNLNRRIEKNDYDDFKKLKECSQNIKIIITSRDTKIVGDDRQHMIKIDPLDIETLLEFYKYYRFENPDKHVDYITEHRALLTELFNRVCCHTLAIELLAKLSRNSSMYENEINEKLKGGLNISPEMVYLVKDDKAFEDTVLEIIKTIFTMSSLNVSEKSILRHLTLVSTDGMELNLFKELAGYNNLHSEISRLIARSWIIMDERTKRIWLHPLICEVALNEDTTKPSKESCSVFIRNIATKIEKTVKYSREWHVLNKAKGYYVLKVLFAQFQYIVPYLKNETDEDDGRGHHAIPFLNKSLREYLDMDSPELSQMQTLSNITNEKIQPSSIESEGKLSKPNKNKTMGSP